MKFAHSVSYSVSILILLFHHYMNELKHVLQDVTDVTTVTYENFHKG